MFVFLKQLLCNETRSSSRYSSSTSRDFHENIFIFKMLGLIVFFQNITLRSFTSYTIINILEITSSYTSYFMRIVSLRVFFSPISGNQTVYHFRIASYFPSFGNHSQFTIHELTILERLKVNEPILENSLRHFLQISIDLVVQLYLAVERGKDGSNAALVGNIARNIKFVFSHLFKRNILYCSPCCFVCYISFKICRC